MPPLVIWQSDATGLVTDRHVAHYERSAGAGLVIVEATAIAPEGRLAATQLGIWSDDHLPGLARLARTISASGALAGIQLHHAGGNATMEKTCGLAPRVPSLVEGSPDGAREMSDEEVELVVAAFARATRRALGAGFRVIELHGAHGYLISQFLSPGTNRRRDRWGGSPERRAAFLTEAVAAARREIESAGLGGEAALTVRLGLAASDPRALSLDEGCDAARAAVAAGVDFLDISNAGPSDDALSAAIRDRARRSGIEPIAGRSPVLLLAAIAKSSVRVPVIGVSGLRTPEQAADAVDSGIADLVAVGRGILADPRWAAKALGTDLRSIELCQDCAPSCHWFREPATCPARRRLARRGEQEAL